MMGSDRKAASCLQMSLLHSILRSPRRVASERHFIGEELPRHDLVFIGDGVPRPVVFVEATVMLPSRQGRVQVAVWNVVLLGVLR